MEEEKKYKICKNRHCGKRFYRRPRETINAFRIRIFCTRKCQQYWRNVKKGVKTGPHSFSYATFHDKLTQVITKSREVINKTQVTTYSCKTMTQEELRKLIPSSGK